MSDLGLFGSVYDQLRSYSDRIDRLLITIASPGARERSGAEAELAELLRRFAQPETETSSHALRLVTHVLRQEFSSSDYPNGFTTLAEELEKGVLDDNGTLVLERIAATLDRKCSEMRSRMREGI